MKQLVELRKQAERFEELNTEIIVVFREEQGGVEALKKIQESTKTDFTLALDFEKQTTGQYSSDGSAFDNYLIDRSGKVAKIFSGKKTVRATANEIIKAIRELPEDSKT